jgi:hypothetical protein
MRHKVMIPSRDWLFQKYIAEQLSCRDIGNILGVHLETIRRHLKKNGIAVRSIAEGANTPSHLKRLSLASTGRIMSDEVRAKNSLRQRGVPKARWHMERMWAAVRGRKHTAEELLKMSEGHKADKNGNWKGGNIIRRNGYIITHAPNHPYANSMGYVFKHRLIAEKAMGRYLRAGEVVHHVNGNGSDNRNQNLLVCKNDFHLWLHRRIRRKAAALAKNVSGGGE